MSLTAAVAVASGTHTKPSRRHNPRACAGGRTLAARGAQRHKHRDGHAFFAVRMDTLRLMAAIALGTAAPALAQEATLIEGARVFDGTGAAAKVQDVLVSGGTILSVGKGIDAPEGVTRVDGRGKTLIPGLHDLHTHLRSPALDAPEDLGKAWAGYLLAGVSTVNDYSV